MRTFATSILVILALTVASAAMALDLQTHGTPIPNQVNSTQSILVLIGCDNGIASNAYFQDTDGRYGNLFNFGGGSLLSKLQFEHYGFGFPGPYSYDVELWDPTSCTFIVAKSGLTAADAAGSPMTEDLNLCGDNLFATGTVAVTIDPNSCAAPNDCYPDVLFDTQTAVLCPVVVQNGSTTPACFDVSSQSGPFLLRIELNTCPTPTNQHSWGQVKTLYR